LQYEEATNRMSRNQQQQQKKPAPYTPTFKDQSRSVVQPIAVEPAQQPPAEAAAPAPAAGRGEGGDGGRGGLLWHNSSDQHDDHLPIASAHFVCDEEGVVEKEPVYDMDANRTSLEDDTKISQTKAMSSIFGGGMSFSTMSKRTKYVTLAIASLLVVIAVVVGVLVATNRRSSVTSSDGDQQKAEALFFSEVGDGMDGTAPYTYLGTALALSESGHRMVAASATAVRVYELVADDWQQIGQDIVIESAAATAGTAKLFNLQDPGLMAIATDSTANCLVIGFGRGGFAEQGMVHVYEYVDPFNSWNLTGTPLFGTAAGSRFGTAVDMNADGNVIAVGAPGQDGSPGLINIYQRDSDGEWGQRGGTILGDSTSTAVSELGRSVSLSASGDRVAAGARSLAAAGVSSVHPADVSRIYEYNRFGDLQWTALGDGIHGGSLTTSTGWYVDLSDAGDIIVVSNAYLQEADFVNVNPDDLVVQAYQWINGVWEQLGGKLHAGIEGPKSGFVVSLSGDGLTIGMGDSGSSTGGRSQGHAHIYKFIDNEWVQVGPNIMGQADGDSFGFSVVLSGDGMRFAVGAPYNRAAGVDTGRVRVFEL